MDAKADPVGPALIGAPLDPRSQDGEVTGNEELTTTDGAAELDCGRNEVRV